MMDQLIFTDEAAIAGAPVPFLTINSVAPTIMRYGTDEQKAFFLPKIAAGELHFSIGYPSPARAPTSRRCAPPRCSTATSSSSTARKCGPASSPTPTGFGWRSAPIPMPASTRASRCCWCRRRRRVSPTRRCTPWPGRHVGHLLPGCARTEDGTRRRIGRGWPLVTNQLNNERVALCSAAPIQTALRETTIWAQQTKTPTGERVIDTPWVRSNLARVHAGVEFLKLINWKIASQAGSGQAPSPADASATKVYGTEFATEAYRLLMQVVGPAATLRQGSTGAHFTGPPRAVPAHVADPHLRRRHQ